MAKKAKGLRHPKTANEKRADEQGAKVRSKRKAKRLPSSWDDLWQRALRSWKQRKKRKQWER